MSSSSSSSSSISSPVLVFSTGAKTGVTTGGFLLLSAFARGAFGGCFVFVEAAEGDVPAVGVHVDFHADRGTSLRNGAGAGVDL